MIANPIATVKGLASLVRHPVTSAKMIVIQGVKACKKDSANLARLTRTSSIGDKASDLGRAAASAKKDDAAVDAGRAITWGTTNGIQKSV
jgi:hypothetical protein